MMESTHILPVNGGAGRSWDHIWVLDALFAVLLKHVDDVATTTMKDGFSMEFSKNGVSLCALNHFGDKPPTLFVNVSVGRELWFALFGVAHENHLEFSEFEETGETDTAASGEKED